MTLTQRFARVTLEYLERCRSSALDSPGATPGWDPPEADLLDTDWALWGLVRYGRSAGADAGLVDLLDRAASGDTTVGYLDHDDVYEGFGDPPRMLLPQAVAEVSRALDTIGLDALLAELPAGTEEAATACGFDPGFDGDVRAYLVWHFEALREFYRVAAGRGECVVAWTD
ncbi:DUF1877 family protein [Streptomyces mangrovisoli]|uniref:DUF1877 domain-containing protein n=1 Tax=Streptomyces mangrovisoli TaxID=1428628 RepID=A0A1J4NZN0_9ACTN|nr:DUF1877 family protein [Streptomyces mangrovisoli]OIJ66932.1 DUF1877 domain-containing protein [Streptomyces mangrovisoli]